MGVFRNFPYSNFHEMNMDEIIKIVKTLAEEWSAYQIKWGNLYDDTEQALADFKAYVQNYWDTLDLTEEVDTVIRKMVAEGSLDSVITSNLSPVVTNWLNNNITTPETVVIDKSLTVEGAVADAKSAGEIRNGVNNILESYGDIVATSADGSSYSIEAPYVLGSDGSRISVSDPLYQTSNMIPVQYGQMVFFKISRSRFTNQNWAFYDADGNVVKHSGKSASGITTLYNEMIFVPWNASYFCVAMDMHDQPTTQQMPNVKVVTEYAENIDINHEPINVNIDSGSISIEEITGTKQTNHILSLATVSDLPVSGDPQPNFSVSTFDVESGTYINIKHVATRYVNCMYAFYDIADNPLFYVARTDNNTHDYGFVKVPYGAVKLLVSGYQTTPTVERIDSINIGSDIAWNNKKWACMGDSLTDENNVRATKRYFNYISDYTGINVVNLGVSGTGYMKPYNGGLPFYQRVDTIPLDADVITIFGSGNDCSLTLGTPTDTGTDTVCGCINATIDGIRARKVGANIGIISPTPWDKYPTYTDNAMSRYCEALEQICNLKGVPFLNLYRCSNMLPWEESFRNAFYTRDVGNGVHPDENGHKFFAPHIMAFIKTLLM